MLKTLHRRLKRRIYRRDYQRMERLAATCNYGAAAPEAAPYICDCTKTCKVMTCEEAYYQLEQCGCTARDGDADGVPCESICSGG